MSLLDTASLLLTPNAYKEGKLYSVIPSDGSGDFTFTRATTATRVNSDGLVELVPYNLLQRSEEFDNAIWSKSSGVTITANTTTAPDGTLTADKLIPPIGTSFTYYISQGAFGNCMSIFAKAAEKSKLLIYSGVANSNAYFDLENGQVLTTLSNVSSATIEDYGNGWYRCSVVWNTTSTLVRIYAADNDNSTTVTGNGIDGIYIWGAQLVEGSDALPYQKTETRLNIPRLDYSLGGCPNILLEPQRTNLALQSSSFDNASWTKAAVSVTANNIISPSGVQDADLIIADGTTTQHNVLQTISAGAKTYSVFAKMGTQRYIQILTSGTVNTVANYDLQDGVANMVGSNSTASIEDYGNGWYRCILQTNEAAAANFYVNYVNSLVAPRFQSVLSSDTLYLWGAQAEVGEYATSYIPTTTASVTRNADVILLSNIYTNNLLTSSGGTWFVDFKNNVPLTRDTTSRFGLGDTAAISLNSMYFIGGASNGRLIIQKRVAGVTTTLYTTTTDTCKIAFKWNGATMDIFENGVKVIADSVFTSTDLNFFNGIIGTPLFISSMLLAPTPLTDDELEALTGEGFDTYALMANNYNYILQ